MIKIGITGGIGSGKSVVGELLKIHQIPLYIADKESKILTATSLTIRKQLTDLFGTDIYNEHGINRSKLSSLIFNDPKTLQVVNSIIHPAVKADFNSWIKKQHSEWCAFESAILFESGFDQSVDVRLFVSAPLEIRIKRAIKRDSLSREDVLKRINNQTPEEKLIPKCDYTIYNDDIQAVIPQVEKFIRHIQMINKV